MNIEEQAIRYLIMVIATGSYCWHLHVACRVSRARRALASPAGAAMDPLHSKIS